MKTPVDVEARTHVDEETNQNSCFSDWSAQKPRAENAWQDLPLCVQGEVCIHAMRDAQIYAAAHTTDGDITLARIDGAQRLSFAREQIINNHVCRIIGAVSMADFADGRVAFFAMSADNASLCGMGEDIDAPIQWFDIGSPIDGRLYVLARSHAPFP